MTTPTHPPPPPPPPPHWPPPPSNTVPAARHPSKLVPLLIVGAIVAVTLMAGAAAAVMLVMMGRAATPAPTAPETPPAAEAFVEPPAPTPAPVAPDTALAQSEPASDAPAPPADERARARARETPRERPARSERQAIAERERPTTESEERDPEPVERAIRVGGSIQPPRKVRNVQPVYPQIAQSARVQGVVIIEATIDRSGRVSATRLLRSIPLLDQAALDAVRQWEYVPTLLNGVAVPVIMTVTVNFTLRP